MNRAPLAPGEIQRLPASAIVPTTATGYYLGCPACGARNVWLADEGPVIREGAPIRDEGEAWGVMAPFYRPATLETERTEPCRACGQVVTVRAGELVASVGFG